MPNRDDDGTEEGDDFDYEDDLEDDDSDEDDFEDDESEPTIACPYCHAEIHEDSQRCPFCENYISGEDSPPQPKPFWIVVGVVVCLIVVLLWIL